MPIVLDRPPPARVSAAIARLAAAGHKHPIPLFRALLAEEIALALLDPVDRLPLSFLDPLRFRKPLVIVLGGDFGADGRADCGPEGWPQSRRLLRWARWAPIHGTGGQVWHYGEAVEAARICHRVLLAECGTATLPAWEAMRAQVAPSLPGVTLRCRPGDFHPRFATARHEART